MSDAKPKTKALVVATRCMTVEQFVATFHRFCDDSTFFVATLSTRPVGLETAFSIQLDDKTPVLRGLCNVVEAWSTPANRYGRPGVRLSVKRLTNESLVVFKQLQTARKAAELADAAKAATPAPVLPVAPPMSDAAAPVAAVVSPAAAAPPKLPPLRPIPRATPPAVPVVPVVPVQVITVPPLGSPAVPRASSQPVPIEAVETALELEPQDSPEPLDYVPEPIPASDDLTNPIAAETRTPGSSFILPANPLMNLTDSSLQGFVDCALYEETGNFFRAPEYEDSLVDIDDVVAAPPHPARPAPRTLTPVPALRPNAFVPPSRDDEFAPELTPLPMLAGIEPRTSSRAATPLPMPEMPRGGRAPTPPVFDDSQGMFGQQQQGQGPPPRPTPPAPPVHPVPLDSTATLIAINRKRERKRWLVIGGVAASVSLLLLVIVVAKSGKGANTEATAATSASTPSTPTTPSPSTKPAIAVAPKQPTTETQATTPTTPTNERTVSEPVDEPPGDPNAPPIAGTGPCRVTVTSSPAGSIVLVDDQAYGPSPITIDGPCAKRRIDVKHPRYALGTKWVTLAAGKPSSIDIPLARPTHTVMVLSSPSGATVSIAGRRAGTTPTSVKVMGFTGVTLTVEKKGFRTETQKLYSKVDGDKLSVKLVRGK